MNQSTDFDILSRAHELLQNGWCRGGLAVDEAGDGATPGSEQAKEHCSVGALSGALMLSGLRSFEPKFESRVNVLIYRVARSAGYGGTAFYAWNWLVEWNNARQRTHSEVLAVFARAAEEARQEGEK